MVDNGHGSILMASRRARWQPGSQRNPTAFSLRELESGPEGWNGFNIGEADPGAADGCAAPQAGLAARVQH